MAGREIELIRGSDLGRAWRGSAAFGKPMSQNQGHGAPALDIKLRSGPPGQW